MTSLNSDCIPAADIDAPNDYRSRDNRVVPSMPWSRSESATRPALSRHARRESREPSGTLRIICRSDASTRPSTRCGRANAVPCGRSRRFFHRSAALPSAPALRRRRRASDLSRNEPRPASDRMCKDAGRRKQTVRQRRRSQPRSSSSDELTGGAFDGDTRIRRGSGARIRIPLLEVLAFADAAEIDSVAGQRDRNLTDGGVAAHGGVVVATSEPAISTTVDNEAPAGGCRRWADPATSVLPPSDGCRQPAGRCIQREVCSGVAGFGGRCPERLGRVSWLARARWLTTRIGDGLRRSGRGARYRRARGHR